MKSQAGLLGLLGFGLGSGLAGLAAADPTWPLPEYDEIEAIVYQAQSFKARKFFDTVSPCANEASGPGRQNAAEWLRTAFHDMSTRSDFFDLGGLDASLQYELDDGENTGPGHRTTLEFMGPFLSPRSSLSDLIAAGVYASVRSCGGPIVPLRAGRVDATHKGDVGVPQPENSAYTFMLQFERMGFSQTEGIQLTACGHTIGGVHTPEFPDIVPDGTALNGEVGLDSSVAIFDNSVVTEYLDGITRNPLVVGPSVQIAKNSDFKVFNMDGNQTMAGMTNNTIFLGICQTVLAKMIDTVPKSVKLTDPIVPYTVKPDALQLTLQEDGNSLHFTGFIRVRTTGLADGAIRGVTINYKNRAGASDCGSSSGGGCAIATTVQGISQGLDDTFSWFPIDAVIPAASGISSFTVDVTTSSGTTTTFDNNGVGYPLQDAILLQRPQSCVLGSSGKLTAVAAVRNDRVPQGARATIWYKIAQTNSPIPRLSNVTVDMAQGSCVGQYTLFSVDYTIQGGFAYQSYVDVTNGDESDSFQALATLGGTCRAFASTGAACGGGPGTPSGTSTGPVSVPTGASTTTTLHTSIPSSSAVPPTTKPTASATSKPPGTTSSVPTGTRTSSSSVSSSSSSSSSLSTTAPAPTPTHKSVVGGYVFQSCFTEGDGVRALSGATFANDSMTLESCEAFCSSFPFWATEYGRECYCGNSLASSSVKAAIGECNMPCAGDATEFCGAGNRLELYSTTATLPPSPTGTPAAKPTISPFVLVGCWTEGSGVRALSQAFFTGPSMTNELCAASCAGFKYFGTEYGDECYCGDSLAPSSAAAPDADCAMTCSGDGLDLCGGSDRLTLYADPSSGSGGQPPVQPPTAAGGFVFAGCWTEGNGTRALTGAAFYNETMTNDMCGLSCAGFDIFGTEYGAECYCGDALAASSARAPAGDCGMLCGGDDGELCGAGNRLSVYTKNGTVVPPA